jgi:hypothetical protein
MVQEVTSYFYLNKEFLGIQERLTNADGNVEFPFDIWRGAESFFGPQG